MENIFFNDEILSAEREIIASLKIPSLLLMENAGSNSAAYINKHFSNLRTILILSGKGNNAGDGFVVARQLARLNYNIKVLMLYSEKELKGDAKVNFEILKNTKSDNLRIADCKFSKELKKEIGDINESLMVDAVFGVGFRGKPEKRIADIFKFVNESKVKVVSLDTPSGLYSYHQSSPAIKADITLAMGVTKFNSLFYKGRESSGNINVMSIGISDSEFTKQNSRNIFLNEIKDIRKLLPKRKINSNKYSNGKVFVLTGSKGLTGASYLCSLSALRAGSGAVIIGIPESLSNVMEKKLTEVMKLPLKETAEKTLSLKSYEQFREKITWADTVLIGPGLSKNEETMELVRKVVRENDSYFVLDADAINAFRDNINLLRNRKIVLTPHTGEFGNLIGKSTDEVISNFYDLARDFAKEHKVVVVLKNSPTIITDGITFYINSTGRENLATAGTGDVLSGLISAELARTKNLLNSAAAGVYIHGMCGDRLYDKTGPDSTIASDLIDEIPEVKNQIRNI